MRIIYCTFSLTLLLACFSAVHAAPVTQAFKLVAAEAEIFSMAGLTATEWRRTDELGQSVGLHRYRSPGTGIKAVLFYLPGTNMNGTLKTLDESHNLWLFLARQGVTVYAMDYRTRFVPHDFDGDLGFMREWSMDLFVEDALAAAGEIAAQTAGAPVYLAGFSRGAAYAYAVAGQGDYAGLVVLDGSFKQTPYRDYDLVSALQRFDQEGRIAQAVSRRGHAKRSELMLQVIEDPGARAADPDFDTAAEHLKDVLYRAWGPGVLANSRDDVSDIQVLAKEMQAYDWFFPGIQDIEGASIRSQADDPNTWIDDQWGELSLPVIYFGAGGFGPESLLAGIHSAARSGSADVTIHVLENYGHLDLLFGREAAGEVYQVIHDWMMSRLRGADAQ